MCLYRLSANTRLTTSCTACRRSSRESRGGFNPGRRVPRQDRDSRRGVLRRACQQIPQRRPRIPLDYLRRQRHRLAVRLWSSRRHRDVDERPSTSVRTSERDNGKLPHLMVIWVSDCGVFSLVYLRFRKFFHVI